MHEHQAHILQRMKARRLGPTAAPPAPTAAAARPSAARARCADKGRVVQLEALPCEVIGQILAFLPPLDIARASLASRLFWGAPGGRSPVEHALRERARRRGREAALQPVLRSRSRSTLGELLERAHVYELARAHASPVAAGYQFSAFVDAEGGLHTCGEEMVWDEDTGQWTGERRAHVAIGHSGAPALLVPTRVPSLSAVRVVAVAAGSFHLLALSDAGTVYACGKNRGGQLGLGDTQTRHRLAQVRLTAAEPVVCIAAGLNDHAYSLALTAAGCAYSWGRNSYGQLGHGDTEQRREPTRIETLDGVRVGGVAAGPRHALFLATRGSVYSCGDGDCGQLGHGDRQVQHTPRRIEALAGVRIVRVSAGEMHSLVVDAAGGVHGFGNGMWGRLGLAPTRSEDRPTRVGTLSGVRVVSASCGLLWSTVVGADGSVRTFGFNGNAVLGHPAGPKGLVEIVRRPRRVAALSRECVVHVSLGNAAAFFVTADGSVFVCGVVTAALGLGVGCADDLGVLDMPARIEQLPPLGVAHFWSE